MNERNDALPSQFLDKIPMLTKACADMLENRTTLAEAGQAARHHVERHYAMETEAQALVEADHALLSRPQGAYSQLLMPHITNMRGRTPFFLAQSPL